ncbi:hypothetical protein CCAX7_33200 [Capsulimonas corticalis]|uniref:Uncharacterized protein n=1 Tax=Capsulimonas corticalis TaxID=2219043 RepID=A0A402CYP9_9BACT|nr:ribosomal protein L7/L12 [Capsulimonas corticalis]BDI31269.1 hypothetical protein CCAX7_33200 [Capsulimonas corticalis]
MASAKIEMAFEGNPPFSPPPTFHTGQIVRGIIIVTPAANTHCRHLWVSLQWRTEGRGDCDTGVAEKLDCFQGSLIAGVLVQIPFQFTLPQSPWSYSGKYVSIVWEVTVDVDVPWKVNPHGALPFVLTSASRASSTPSPHSTRSQPTSSVNAQASFTIPSGEAAGVDMILQNVTGSENPVMQAIHQELPRLSLQEIQDLINAVPAALMENVEREIAEPIAARLTAAGAVIQILSHSRETL